MELNKIYNEDCLVGMQRIPDKSVDVVICDLPYGTTECQWDSIIPADKLWEQYLRITKDNASFILFGSEPFSTYLRMSNIKMFKYDWIWKKTTTTGFQHAKNMPLKDYEIISVFSKGSMGHANLLGDKRMTYNPQGIVRVDKQIHGAIRKAGGVIGKRPSHKDTYNQEYTNYPRMILEYAKDPNCQHPTQKPVALIEYLIKTYTNEGGVVLDNCMGSGTTAVAAINTKRQFVGFELEKKYFDIAERRIKEAMFNSKQLTLFEDD